MAPIGRARACAAVLVALVALAPAVADGAHPRARGAALPEVAAIRDALTRPAPDAESRAFSVALAALDARTPMLLASQPALASPLAVERAHLLAAMTLDARLKAAAGAPDATRLEALAALAAQSSALGLPALAAPAVRSDASPSAALLALVTLDRAPFTPSDAAAATSLDHAGEPARSSLTRFIDAFIAFDAAARLAWGSPLLPPDEASVAAVVAARAVLVARAFDLRDALAATDLTAFDTCSPITSGSTYTIDLGACSETYTRAFELSIDAGGADVYLNNAGGNGPSGCAPGAGFAAAAAVDFGGDDRYGSGFDCGVNGGAIYGAGFLADFAGNDTYDAGGAGVNGGAYYPETALSFLLDGGPVPPLGLGFLLDVAGNDTYRTNGCGGNGGAMSDTAGLLVDLAGNDAYRATYDGRCTFPLSIGDVAGTHGANGGGAGGAGFLIDATGDDRYDGVGFGVNGGAALFPGSAGFLFDGAGDDQYVADNLLVKNPSGRTAPAQSDGVNGGASSGGAGSLFDARGNDRYSAASLGDAYSAGANGGAADLFGTPAVGLLVDGAGDDHYRATATGANGGGGDVSAGFLIDGAGRDVYVGGSKGANGGADLGFGLLVDGAGDDAYHAGAEGANGGAASPSDVALLYDASGHDQYDDAQGGTGTDTSVYAKGAAMATQLDGSTDVLVPVPLPVR
ncbi:MAG: hypothetical protein ACYDCK_07270 [Thermoplasmatota archaeon]